MGCRLRARLYRGERRAQAIETALKRVEAAYQEVTAAPIVREQPTGPQPWRPLSSGWNCSCATAKGAFDEWISGSGVARLGLGPFADRRELTRSGGRVIDAGSWKNLRLHQALCQGIAGRSGAQPSRLSSKNGPVGDSDFMRRGLSEISKLSMYHETAGQGVTRPPLSGVFLGEA
jgi:hypothetical protein